MKLHRQAFVFDAHCDTAMRLVGDERIDLGDRHADGHIDLPRARDGGLDAQIFAVWVSPQMPESLATERARAMIDALWEQARKHPGRNGDRPQGRRRSAHRQGGQARGDRRDRGRASHRRGSRRAPRLLRARRPVHDPHVDEHEQMGRLVGRHDDVGRAFRFRALGRAGDGPARDDHRLLARLGEDPLRRSRDDEEPRSRLALVHARPHRYPPERERRRAPRGAKERRRRLRQLLRRISRQRVSTKR